MPTITAISPQKRKGRYNIFVDGKFGFGTDEDTLVKEQLTVGKEISEWELERLIDESEVGKLYQKTLRFLGFRPRSEREVRDYLKRKILNSQFSILNSESREGPTQSAIEAIVGRLKKSSYIDDEAFSRWWVEQRREHRPRGKFLLQKELSQKGIDRKIVEEVLETKIAKTAEDAKNAEIVEDTEVKLALKAAQKKLKAYKNLEPFEFRRKLGAYLTRRGFEWEVIKEVVDELLEKR